MNRIQGCVYIVKNGPPIPVRTAPKADWNSYFAATRAAAQLSAPFQRAVQEGTGRLLFERPSVHRTITDDEQGVEELNDFLGNDSVVLLDAEHLPYVRSALVSNGKVSDHQSTILLYDNEELKDLALFQGASLLSD